MLLITSPFEIKRTWEHCTEQKALLSYSGLDAVRKQFSSNYFEKWRKSGLGGHSALCYKRPMLQRDQDLSKNIQGHDGILVIRAPETWRSWNGITYKDGMSGKNVGSRKLSMNVATIPPGGVAKAHIHVDFEVMLYILKGNVRHEYGPGLRRSIENSAGDFIYIEPGVPHEVFNMSDSEPVMAVVARSDASEWENIIPYERNSE